MTTAASVRTAADGRARRAGPPPGTALPTRQRKPAYIALLVALVVGLAALGAYWYSRKVGVEVKPGQIPADGLPDGASVEVLQLPGKDAAGGSAQQQPAAVLAQQATVYSSAADPSQSGGTLLTLVVPKSSAAPIAAASNAGAIALVQVGQ